MIKRIEQRMVLAFLALAVMALAMTAAFLVAPVKTANGAGEVAALQYMQSMPCLLGPCENCAQPCDETPRGQHDCDMACGAHCTPAAFAAICGVQVSSIEISAAATAVELESIPVAHLGDVLTPPPRI